jgi:hypothetical protein
MSAMLVATNIAALFGRRRRQGRGRQVRGLQENKMPDVDSSDSSSGIAVDVQQRLNCALPSFVL